MGVGVSARVCRRHRPQGRGIADELARPGRSGAGGVRGHGARLGSCGRSRSSRSGRPLADPRALVDGGVEPPPVPWLCAGSCLGGRHASGRERLRPLQRRFGDRRGARCPDRDRDHLRRGDRLARLCPADVAAPLRRVGRGAAGHSDLGALAPPYFFTVATYRGFPPAGYVGFVFGLGCGSIVLTWLYYGSGGSILACTVWHGVYNLATGPGAATGTIQAVTSAFVYVQAFLLVGLELRARRRGEASILCPAEPASRRRTNQSRHDGPAGGARRRAAPCGSDPSA